MAQSTTSSHKLFGKHKRDGKAQKVPKLSELYITITSINYSQSYMQDYIATQGEQQFVGEPWNSNPKAVVLYQNKIILKNFSVLF